MTEPTSTMAQQAVQIASAFKEKLIGSAPLIVTSAEIPRGNR
jgi:hypothetical protein